MLTAMFVSAVFAFGKIDLIGHSLIVVALLGIIVDDGGKPARIRDFWLMPAAYVASLALFLATYYMVHAEQRPAAFSDEWRRAPRSRPASGR